MREILQASETNPETKKQIESLLELFNMKLSSNTNTNYAMLLFINNLYYKTVGNIKDIQKQSDENIHRLYKYNKLKDTAQEILGKLAELKGVTNKKIAQEYDAPE
ncbi:hypothetical protein NEAUS04_0125 [Nematocida ausubeli]|uniref:Uncharacterized protein n=1 Tax=Nematocida ausubeli (strain ATCC PRA-371 / ERTm2) TaxID=1913371 RepID=H8Z9H4_NEMA1|nr:uncharacterized protein NESG_00848 [Nematocida ausubeli]EHY66605.1 hypothetical protein NERG_00245 [Nematocida ausubeli]KAI5133779.1 hypothetical protein NEAUS06_0751 [Nematocida ausubeli]KAI5137115.1 hypothetical protein NEAUS07_1830 [Nematocida ausubeli]KAI5149686.1 hypothetical protein NEAUS05_1863 [Nematocida ausubeli]KAI5160751.1 hypothetical protein NEAUS04_0125 [Nematocida ausubeli]